MVCDYMLRFNFYCERNIICSVYVLNINASETVSFTMDYYLMTTVALNARFVYFCLKSIADLFLFICWQTMRFVVEYNYRKILSVEQQFIYDNVVDMFILDSLFLFLS